jgi:putative peptide zinc metalloprotease protein
VLKALHEFGHGYATKVFGGAVREFGLMLIVFAPVPYVDASSSSAFRGKWQRALVAAAGMLVELFVAALAMFVWVLVEPGAVRAVAYNVMLIAGMSTVVFNANPLLRLDGYYILSDLIEVPNLGARSNRFWGWLVERHAFGADRESPHTTTGERLWLVVYAPLAFVYRMIVMFGIALFVAGEFFVVGVLIGTWSVVTGLLWPIWKGLAHVLTGPGLREKRKRAATVTVGAGAACAGLLLLVPAPLHTTAEGVVWLPEESFVRAATDGFINRVVTQPGEQVSPGTPLIESEDPNLLVEARVLRSQVEALAVKLEAEQFTDRVQADLTRQELAIRQASLGRVMEQADQLVIRSAAVGSFVVPRAQDLPGRYVKRGEVVGYIIGLQARVLRVVVTQSDIELVRQRLVDIEVKFPDRPATTVAATMLREVPSGSERLPSKALTEAGGGQLAIDPSDSDQTKTLQRTFQFDLALSEFAPGQFGGRVFVRFAHGSEPLGWQFYRRIRQLLLARFHA